jgi:hypothetical protein
MGVFETPVEQCFKLYDLTGATYVFGAIIQQCISLLRNLWFLAYCLPTVYASAVPGMSAVAAALASRTVGTIPTAGQHSDACIPMSPNVGVVPQMSDMPAHVVQNVDECYGCRRLFITAATGCLVQTRLDNINNVSVFNIILPNNVLLPYGNSTHFNV